MKRLTLPPPDKTTSIYAIEVNDGNGWKWDETDQYGLPVFLSSKDAEFTAERVLRFADPSLQYRIREFSLTAL